MNNLRVAVQMDALDSLNPITDSTLALIEEGIKRGHQVFTFMPKDLSWHQGKVSAQGTTVRLISETPLVFETSDPQQLTLEEFDVVFIRQEPPFDLGYLTATYILEHLRGKVLLVNDPQGIRDSPEKLLVTYFADLMPPTLISQSLQEIQDFRAQQGDIVIKPLYAFGGESVLHFTAQDGNLEAALDLFRRAYPREPWMIQQFLPEIRDGDRRFFLVDGELMGGFARIPALQQIRSNYAQGGRPQAIDISDRERALCGRLGPLLRARGLFFVGIDLIGPYLTEINVTCPTGLRLMNNLYQMNATKFVWQALEKKV